MCTKGRDIVNTSWWLALTRNFSLKTDNCNDLSPSQWDFKDYSSLCRLVEYISVALPPRHCPGNVAESSSKPKTFGGWINNWVVDIFQTFCWGGEEWGQLSPFPGPKDPTFWLDHRSHTTFEEVPCLYDNEWWQWCSPLQILCGNIT